MRASVLLLPLLTLALVPTEALAQAFSGGRPGQLLGGAPGSIESRRRPPPPALPGLLVRSADPIPADPNQNLAPTPALFDAISRGDLAAARDAVSRGADTEGRNQLGLTPLDAAVDQGRNEIMFFLLSVRGGRSGPPPEETQRSAFREQPAVPAATRRRPSPAPAAEPVPRGEQTAAAAVPRLWAGDGGVAKPEIGFLGFDAGRPAGAAPTGAQEAPARRSRSQG
jgi:hypothetical protein